MRYLSVPAVQTPIMNDDQTTIIGWDIGYAVMCKGITVEERETYMLDEVDWCPISEQSAKVAEHTSAGIIAKGLIARADAAMDAKLLEIADE